MKSSFLVAIIIAFITFPAFSQDEWAVRIGSGNQSFERGTSLAVDSKNNLYVSGDVFGNADFDGDSIPCPYVRSSFLAKYEPNGKLVWVKWIGDDALINKIVIDASSDNIYIAASSSSTVVFDSIEFSNKGFPSERDCYLVKYSEQGVVVWARQISGDYSQFIEDIDVDRDGNIFIDGWYNSSAHFEDTILENVQTSGFLAKLSIDGKITWIKEITGEDGAVFSAMALDSSGNLYTSGGFTSSVRFDDIILDNIFKDQAAFLAQYSTDGKPLKAVFFRNSNGLDVMCNQDGDVYIAGRFFYGTRLDDTVISSKGISDCLIAKYSTALELIWVKTAGAEDADGINSIAMGANGELYVTGEFTGNILVGNVPLASLQGHRDIFVARYTPDGDALWAIRAGGAGSQDNGESIIADDADNIYITGSCGDSADFGKMKLYTAGGNPYSSDMFIWKVPALTQKVTKSCSVSMQILISPNPSSGMSFLNCILDIESGINISAIDMWGRSRLLYEGELPRGANTIPIDISDLPSGIYSIIVATSRGSKTVQFVKF